jgi:hypothetical protein
MRKKGDKSPAVKVANHTKIAFMPDVLRRLTAVTVTLLACIVNPIHQAQKPIARSKIPSANQVEILSELIIFIEGEVGGNQSERPPTLSSMAPFRSHSPNFFGAFVFAHIKDHRL